MRKSLIARSVALIGGALLSATTFAKQPNILVIWGDDIGGSPLVRDRHCLNN